MLLYIIRHGDPDYANDTLTGQGMLQAEALGKRLAALKIDRVYSSPMGRAKKTAEPTCRLLGLPCHIEEWSHEIGAEKSTPFPDGVSKSVSMVQNTYFRENGNYNLSYKDALTCQGFDRTDMKTAIDYIEARGNAFLERLGYREENGVYRIVRPNDEKVALFCHRAFSLAWCSVLLRIPIHTMWASFGYAHTGVTILQFENNENGVTAPKCLCFSDLSHLYADGFGPGHVSGTESYEDLQ